MFEVEVEVLARRRGGGMLVSFEISSCARRRRSSSPRPASEQKAIYRSTILV